VNKEATLKIPLFDRIKSMEEKSEHTELNAKKWDLRAGTFDEDLHSKHFHFAQKRTIAFLPSKEGICFLDMGCGTGWAVRYVARLLNITLSTS